MAILHHKEEKIQVVLGRLSKNYTHDQFVEMFIKLYSKDWGKIKSAYIKQSQDKEPGTIIAMPKPDLYLKQLVETYIALNTTKEEAIAVKVEKKEEIPVLKVKTLAKKKVLKSEELGEVIKKPKTIIKKKTTENEFVDVIAKKTKASTKKVLTEIVPAEPLKEIKKKAPAKKKIIEEVIEPAKVKKTKNKEK